MDDIEALKQELQQTRLAYYMALQLSQLKGSFLARTVHEIRSPLSSLIGLHQLILSDLCENPDEEREFLTQAYQAAQRLIKIIDTILSVAKLESRTIPLEIKPFQVSQLLSDLYHLTHLQAANRGLRLEIQPAAADLYIWVDGQKFVQSLMALIDAAICHLAEGSIEVSAQVPDAGETVQITITAPCPLSFWQREQEELLPMPEPTPDFLKSWGQTLAMSPSMKFCLAQSSLAVMQGHLSAVEVLPQTTPTPLTQLVCLLPKAPSEGEAH
jgi:hypothetical protein